MWNIPTSEYGTAPRLMNLKNGEYVTIIYPESFKLDYLGEKRSVFICSDNEYVFWTHEAREAGLIKPERIDAATPNLADACQKEIERRELEESQHGAALLGESIIKIEYGE